MFVQFSATYREILCSMFPLWLVYLNKHISFVPRHCMYFVYPMLPFVFIVVIASLHIFLLTSVATQCTISFQSLNLFHEHGCLAELFHEHMSTAIRKARLFLFAGWRFDRPQIIAHRLAICLATNHYTWAASVTMWPEISVQTRRITHVLCFHSTARLIPCTMLSVNLLSIFA